VAIGPRTTYRVGGPAALFWEAETVEDLLAVAAALAATDEPVPVLVLGRGSNLLVADAGFAGLVVTLAGPTFGSVAFGSAGSVAEPGVASLAEPGTLPDGDVDGGPDGDAYRAWVGGAVALPVLARQSAAAGLTGLEWAVGVPGSVGGAVRMNAGGHGADTRASLVRCRVVDLRRGSDEIRTGDELALGYRRSAVAADHVVVSAEYRLEKGTRAHSEETIREILRWRREHQPGGQNAGSVFVNPRGTPPGDSAGWLVDAAGLKGLRHGSAEVSAKHANFIQADPGGSADDVLALMLEVQQRVKQRLGVLLRAETRLLGFPQHSLSTLGSDDGDDE
jgi:UDP-N-acetylmuramate dehydrogenase